MKVVILAGGKGQRLAEHTVERPKALIEIGQHPILWHLISYFEQFDFDDFVVATGAQKEKIVRYFLSTGVAASAHANRPCVKEIGWHGARGECRVTLVDTGAETATGGRIKRCGPFLDDDIFVLTWCDGLADVDLNELIDFHRRHGRLATLTAVRPPPRFGRLALDGDDVSAFAEKAALPDEWINGAFFVLDPKVLDLIPGDDTSFEHHVLPVLAKQGQLKAYRHERFWACMDTIHDHQTLQALWQSGNAPWKVWSADR